MPLPREASLELKTRRFVLRCPQEGDGRLLHDAVAESLSELRAWPASLPWAMAEPSLAASEAFCRDSSAAFLARTSLVYLVFAPSGALQACTSLHAIQWDVPKCELGFWVRAARQREGVVTEVVAELLRHAFEQLGARRIEALIDERNTASRKVCESVGMGLEGLLRNERVTSTGELVHTCVYAAVR